MCTVSAIGDDWQRRWPQNPNNPFQQAPISNWIHFPPAISREEFDNLKKEVEALKKLLEAAKEYDETTGQPDCHMDEKVALIKQIAALVGINFDEVFK